MYSHRRASVNFYRHRHKVLHTAVSFLPPKLHEQDLRVGLLLRLVDNATELLN